MLTCSHDGGITLAQMTGCARSCALWEKNLGRGGRERVYSYSLFVDRKIVASQRDDNEGCSSVVCSPAWPTDRHTAGSTVIQINCVIASNSRAHTVTVEI